MQRARFWTRRAVEFVLVVYVLGICVVAAADAMHMPIIPDKHQKK